MGAVPGAHVNSKVFRAPALVKQARAAILLIELCMRVRGMVSSQRNDTMQAIGDS
jgi:hypothetical protein